MKDVLSGFDAKTLKSEGTDMYSVASFGIMNHKTVYLDFELCLVGLMTASAVDDLAIFNDVDCDSVEERNDRVNFSARTKNIVSIEKSISTVGQRVTSVTSSPKSSKLLTVVVTNRKLTGSE